MLYQQYAHRFADAILAADDALAREVDGALRGLDGAAIGGEFEAENARRAREGRAPARGRQAAIARLLRFELCKRGWDPDRNVFDDPEGDLKLAFWKCGVGVEVAFGHRAFMPGHLLGLQAAAEARKIVNVGVYICPTRAFAEAVSAQDARSMATFERALWLLGSFCPVLTLPILVIGLQG